MPQHIGIVACSAEGAALCYRTICLEGAELLGRHNHPEVSLHTHPLAEYMKYIDQGDWTGVAELMMSSAEKLARAGADFLICPDNTIHQAFDLVAYRSPRPWLHIAEEVAKESKRCHFKRLGVLGTRYLMEGPVYPEKLKAAGLEHRLNPSTLLRESCFRSSSTSWCMLSSYRGRWRTLPKSFECLRTTAVMQSCWAAQRSRCL